MATNSNIKPNLQRALNSSAKKLLILLLLVLMPTTGLLAKDMPGAAPTSYGVSNGGAFNFSLPIVIPQGTNSIQPNISLNYSSGGGNGLLGVGWSLGGLGAITRCGKTFATNGIKGGVQHNTDDRFCLNGQQLILVNGTYGALNTEYRTELDQIAKIVAKGSRTNLNGGNAPSWWQVHRKDGMIVEYGRTTTSSFELPGTNSIHSWKVGKVIDRNGNYYEVTYETNDGRPDEIIYTKNGTSSVSNQRIDFTYQPREDILSGFVLGKEVVTDKRLRQIRIYKGSTKVREYKLNYEESTVSMRSRITSIQECGLNDECFTPIDVDWQADEQGFGNGTAGNVAPSHLFTTDELDNNKEVTYGQWVDVNGDGEADLIHAVRRPNGNVVSKAWIKEGNDFVEQPNWRLPKPLRDYDTYAATNYFTFIPDVINQGQFVDVNGDGLVDVVYAYAHHVGDYTQQAGAIEVQVKETYLNTGNGWENNPDPNYAPPEFIFSYVDNGPYVAGAHVETLRGRFVDINGDGLVDWMTGWNGSKYGNSNQRATWLNTGSGWQPNNSYKLPTVFVSFYDGEKSTNHGELVDVNGDGLLDWVEAYGAGQGNNYFYGWDTWLNTGSGFVSDPNFRLPWDTSAGDVPIYESFGNLERAIKTGSFVDVNSDGLRDWVVAYQKTEGYEWSWVYLNTGDGWEWDVTYTPPFVELDHIFSADPNHPTRPFMVRGFYVDMNKDGRVDFIQSYKNHDNINHKQVWLNLETTSTASGSKWVLDNTYHPNNLFFNYYGQYPAYRYGSFVDINADGAPDWIDGWKDPTPLARINNTIKTDRLEKITTTMGVEIMPTFLPLTDNEDLYTKGAGEPEADSFHIEAPMYVTSNLKVSNPDGSGFNTTAYSYDGAQVNRLGRGFLGFKQRWTEQLQKRITTYQVFQQDYPYVGRTSLQQVSRHISSTGEDRLLSETVSTYDINAITHPSGNETKFVFMDESTTKSFELNDGIQYREVYTDLNYDDYGNQTLNHTKTGVTDTNDANLVGETLSRAYFYPPNQANWLTGLLERTFVSNRAPGESNKDTRNNFTYDTRGRLATATREQDSTNDSIKLTTTYTYDGYGNIVEERSTSADTSEAERFTTIDYDAQHRLPIKVTNALNHDATVTAYNAACDAPQSTTDANGVVTDYTYDNFCRAERTTTGEIWSETTYDMEPNVNSCANCQVTPRLKVTTRNKGENAINTYFNTHGQTLLSETTDVAGSKIQQRSNYDRYGRLISQSQPYFSDIDTPLWTNYTYDYLDRNYNTILPFKKSNGDDAILRNRYAVDNGLLRHRTINTLGRNSEMYYNALGQVEKVLDHQDNTLEYTYDPQGNLVKTKDVANNEIIITYDILGRRVELNDPDMGITEYEYNAFGETVWQKDAKNQVQTMKYDQLGRMTERTVPGTESGGTSMWTYDTANNGIGLLASVSGPNGYVESYAYDSLSRVDGIATTIKGATYNQTMAYDSNGFLASRRYPDSGNGQIMSVNYNYNNGYLESITSGDPNSANCIEHWRANEYDALGRITQDTLGRVVTSRRTFDQAQGTVDRIRSDLMVGTGEKAQDIEYDYDAMNNVKSRNDQVLSSEETFGYDNLDRLTSYTKDGVQTSVQYDAIGNITFKSDVGTYHYNGATGGPHALAKVTNPLGPNPLDKFNVNWEYDGNTQQTEVPTANGVHADFTIHGKDFVYDANGNIEESGNRFVYWTSFDMPHTIVAVQPNGEQLGSRIEYGPNFQRIYKEEAKFSAPGTLQSVSERTTYVGKDYERITDSNGDVVHRYTILAGGNAIQIEREDGTSTDKASYMLADALGSTNVIINANGEVEQRLGFDPWGMRTNVGDVGAVNGITNRGYTGHEMDTETGLINMNARLYDPYLGRFLSADTIVPDPYDMQQYNRYSYVMNNPLRYTDPTGHNACEEDASTCFGGGDLIYVYGHSPAPPPTGHLSFSDFDGFSFDGYNSEGDFYFDIYDEEGVLREPEVEIEPEVEPVPNTTPKERIVVPGQKTEPIDPFKSVYEFNHAAEFLDSLINSFRRNVTGQFEAQAAFGTGAKISFELNADFEPQIVLASTKGYGLDVAIRASGSPFRSNSPLRGGYTAFTVSGGIETSVSFSFAVDENLNWSFSTGVGTGAGLFVGSEIGYIFTRPED